jgi:hypothetical protein
MTLFILLCMSYVNSTSLNFCHYLVKNELKDNKYLGAILDACFFLCAGAAHGGGRFFYIYF